MRILVTKWVPLGSPYQQTLDLIRADDTPPEAREALLAAAQEAWALAGIDPHAAQPGTLGGEEIHRITLVELFRVHGFGAVLAFWGIVATLIAGVLGLVAALLA